MGRYEDCEVCGERFHNECIKNYLVYTVVGEGSEEEVVAHCRDCKPKKKGGE